MFLKWGHRRCELVRGAVCVSADGEALVGWCGNVRKKVWMRGVWFWLSWMRGAGTVDMIGFKVS